MDNIDDFFILNVLSLIIFLIVGFATTLNFHETNGIF